MADFALQFPDYQGIGRDEKKQIVLNVITEQCALLKDSIEEFRLMHEALNKIKNNNQLQITFLTGGMTNHTYKISLKHEEESKNSDAPSTPVVELFAKLSFSPTQQLFEAGGDGGSSGGSTSITERTANEYKMMRIFEQAAPENVAVPYFCVDCGSNEQDDSPTGRRRMKLLVAQWSSVDEQWGNQFIDGSVDIECAKTFATALSKLHNKISIPNHDNLDNSCFNHDVKLSLRSFVPVLKMTLDGFFNHGVPTMAKKTKNDDDNVQQQTIAAKTAKKVSRVAKFVQETIGINQCEQIMNTYENKIMGNDNKTTPYSYVHGDCHVFNLLTAKKPGLEELMKKFDLDDDNDNSEFDINDNDGKVIFCDWEMSHIGYTGQDFGTFIAFPIACALTHAINGNVDACHNIQHFLDLTWKEYVDAMMRASSDDENINNNKNKMLLLQILRDALGSAAVTMTGYYALGILMDILPIEPSSTAVKDLTMVRQSLGMIAMHYLYWGFGTTTTTDNDNNDDNDPLLLLTELHTKSKKIIDDEIQFLMSLKKPTMKKAGRRRSSLLRESGKRVSDANMHYHAEDLTTNSSS